MSGNKSMLVQGVEVHVTSKDDEDYISLTDMAGNFDGGGSLIEAWLRNKDTIEFLGVWERINNPDFNSLEFEGIRMQAGLEPVYDLRSNNVKNAKETNWRLVLSLRSQFFHNLRHFSNQAKERSTTHRFGMTAKV